MLKYEVRMSSDLYEAMLTDLRRPHEHAFERVGFAFGRRCRPNDLSSIIYLHRYVPVDDDRYIKTHEFGALIDDEAILEIQQEVRRLRSGCGGAFHVHLHDLSGMPKLSPADMIGIPPVARCMQRMDPDGASGLLLLSSDKACAQVWESRDSEGRECDLVSVIGVPLNILVRRRSS